MSARVVIAGDSTPRFAPHVRFRFDEARQRWTVLAPEKLLLPDEQATAILQLLDGARTVDQLIEELARQYEAPADVVGEDVRAMLQDLADKGIVAT